MTQSKLCKVSILLRLSASLMKNCLVNKSAIGIKLPITAKVTAFLCWNKEGYPLLKSSPL